MFIILAFFLTFFEPTVHQIRMSIHLEEFFH